MILACLLSTALAATRVVLWEFEEDDGGFAPLEDDLQWEWGSFSSEYGPMGGGTGLHGWATHLGAPYYNDAPGALGLPSIDLSPYPRPMLTFLHWYDIASGDYAQLALPDGAGGWLALEPVYDYPTTLGWSGRSEGWVRVYVDLSGVSDTAELGFYLFADATVQRPGWYIDEVALYDGDIAPPHLSDLDALPDTEDVDGPYEISVVAADNAPLVSVELHYRVDGGPTVVLAMNPGVGDHYTASIPGVHAAQADVEYRVRATDGENEAWLPALTWESFRVRLPAPGNLRGPEGRVVNTAATLEWDPPDTTNEVLGYRVYRGDLAVANADALSAEVPLAGGGLDTFTVRGVYSAGEGDPSDPLSLDVALPEVLYLGPVQAWQGDSVRLELLGRYMLLRQGTLSAELGAGVNVDSIEVISVDEALLSVVIDDDAPLGVRDVVLTSGDVVVRVDDAFEVLDGAGRPRLLDISPAQLRQGDSATLSLTDSADFAELPLVDLGEGIVVEGVRFADSSTLLVDVVVGPTAPLGDRAVRVDDGRRIHEGVSFTVRDYVPPPTGRCESAPAGGWALTLLALALLRRQPAATGSQGVSLGQAMV